MSNFHSTIALQQYKPSVEQRIRTLRAIRFSPPSTGNSDALSASSSSLLQSELFPKNVLSYRLFEIINKISELTRYENSLKAYRKYASSRIPTPDWQAANDGLSTASLFATASTPETYCQQGAA